MPTSNPSEQRPRLSVLMLAYNHEAYIEQAVRSALMQETNFDYEIVIGEDCSTDRTREILRRLQAEFPDRIRLLLHNPNIGMIPNMIAAYHACQGVYIATLEGDDYWTSPHKLQLQVDLLDAHPECVLSFHAVQRRYENQLGRMDIPTPAPIQNGIVEVSDWLEHLYIATATVVFRVPTAPLPVWYGELRNAGDWPLTLWLTREGGQIRFLDYREPMSVYRIHAGGITQASTMMGSAKRQKRLLDGIADLRLVSAHLPPDQRRLLRPRLFHQHFALAVDYQMTGDRASSRAQWRQAATFVDRFSMSQLRKLLRTGIQLYLPELYSGFMRVRRQRMPPTAES